RDRRDQGRESTRRQRGAGPAPLEARGRPALRARGGRALPGRPGGPGLGFGGSRARRVALLSVPVRGDPSGEDAVAAVRDLRSAIIPATFADTGAHVLVGGTTSEDIDYFDSVIGPAPWVIALVLGLTFVFLTVVFSSLVVAGTAVMLNLLSVAAADRLLGLVC